MKAERRSSLLRTKWISSENSSYWKTLSTIQLDFLLPERFDLHYIGADEEEHRQSWSPWGNLNHERFTAIIVENYELSSLALPPHQVALSSSIRQNRGLRLGSSWNFVTVVSVPMWTNTHWGKCSSSVRASINSKNSLPANRWWQKGNGRTGCKRSPLWSKETEICGRYICRVILADITIICVK